MCMEYSIRCNCGKKQASFNFKNEIMPPEVIESLYCPDCSKDIPVNTSNMLKDKDWVIQFDMEVANLYNNKLPDNDARNLCPEVLFDSGYATWRGVYPGDHIDSVKEREELVKLANINPKKYFIEMRSWATSRMERLKEEGWRKAREV